ncbi:MAG: PadR family transcriptional regulator [Proteobacteria bacterium]|nr:PadR family transcriptional regulator [Pseudomonadota bacterium]
MKTKPSTEYVLLGILMSGPKHGYEIMQFLETALESTWRVSTSQLYALLKRLESQGLLDASVEPQKTRPSRRVFTLTDAGEKSFLEWLRSPTEHVRDFRIEFIGKLFFFHRLSLGGGLALIDAQIQTLKRFQEKMRDRAKKGEDPFNKLVYGLKMETVACYIKWLSRYPEILMRKVSDHGPQRQGKGVL